MASTATPGGEEASLNAIFKQAAELRAAEDAKLRRRFDALPQVVQKTLFYPEEAGRGPEEAKALREKGNAEFHKGRHVDALVLYEDAVRQVWFVTLNPGAPSFRERGIRDEWIAIECLDHPEACTDLLNAALCLVQLREWDQAIETCQAALLHANGDREAQAKALYRGAIAKQRRNRGNDEDEAMMDLSRALLLHDLGGKVTAALDQARAQRLFRLAEEKKMFAGVFEDGDLYEEEPTEQQIKEAAEFGLDLRNPQIKRTLRHMMRFKPGTVEEMVHEKNELRNWEHFQRICMVIVFIVLFTYAMAHLLMRSAAMQQHKLPREFYPPKQSELHLDEL